VPAGRPERLTDELQEDIVQLLRAGNYIETAASAAGVSKRSLYAWMRKGSRQKSGKYREFLHAVKKAMGEGEARIFGALR